MKTPFDVLKRHPVIENQVFELFFDDIMSSNGMLIERYLSVIPKKRNDSLFGGTGVLPIQFESDIPQSVGLIRVYRHPIGKWGYEIPRGFVETGETINEAALREFEEETGISLASVNLEYVMSFCPEPGVIGAQVGLFFAIVDLASSMQNHPPEKELGHDGLEWIEWSQIDQWISDNRIFDAGTLLALLQLKIRTEATR